MKNYKCTITLSYWRNPYNTFLFTYVKNFTNVIFIELYNYNNNNEKHLNIKARNLVNLLPSTAAQTNMSALSKIRSLSGNMLDFYVE